MSAPHSEWEGLPIFRCKNEPHPAHPWSALDGQRYVCERGEDVPPFVPIGCDCDAYDGDHASRCAIYVQPVSAPARVQSSDRQAPSA